FPNLPQVLCFDTAFHRDMPDVAQRFPLPGALWDAGIRGYGVHGLSYEYVVHELGPASRGRVVIAHLGNGASMAAVQDGRSVETTMGLTPTGGLMMGTRPGDLDPGVLLHLLVTRQYEVEGLTRLVERESGLLGVSGLSADMRTLLDARDRDPNAARAIAMFCHRARREVGALAAVLGGMDSLVFTGGIGEHSTEIRQEICRGLEHLGVLLDPDANGAPAPIVGERASGWRLGCASVSARATPPPCSSPVSPTAYGAASVSSAYRPPRRRRRWRGASASRSAHSTTTSRSSRSRWTGPTRSPRTSTS